MMNLPIITACGRHVIDKWDDEYEIDSKSLGKDQSSHIPLTKSQSKHMILGSREAHTRTPISNTYTQNNDPHKSIYILKG